jgi:nucleoside-diphosphate-sugar epimerase
MVQTVFLAGASGAVGQILAPMLVAHGYRVYGTTRHAQRAERLAAQGVVPVVVDVFDANALNEAVAAAKPYAVIHQLTALPPGLDPARMPAALIENARIRDEGTRNLVAAAAGAGARRIIAQSVAWAYRPGTVPYDETQPLDTEAAAPRSVTVNGVIALERAVLESPMVGTVLRYGRFYGPGTGADVAPGPGSVHVEAAAHAALLALRYADGGVFNVAEEGGDVTSARARDLLAWSDAFRVERVQQ